MISNVCFVILQTKKIFKKSQISSLSEWYFPQKNILFLRQILKKVLYMDWLKYIFIAVYVLFWQLAKCGKQATKKVSKKL